MTTLRIDEIVLDTNEEWLVKNALNAYRQAIVQCRDSEAELAVKHNAAGELEYANACERMAIGWQHTVDSVDALIEKLA